MSEDAKVSRRESGDDGFEPTAKDAVVGVLRAAGYYVTGLVEATPHLLETREAEQRKIERARGAAARVRESLNDVSSH